MARAVWNKRIYPMKRDARLNTNTDIGFQKTLKPHNDFFFLILK